jgi:hypothetical protein
MLNDIMLSVDILSVIMPRVMAPPLLMRACVNKTTDKHGMIIIFWVRVLQFDNYDDFFSQLFEEKGHIFYEMIVRSS